MNLADRLHCPNCKGRLTSIMAESLSGSAAGSLSCTDCEAILPAIDGIPDFVGGAPDSDADPLGLIGDSYGDDVASAALQQRIRLAAGDHWPASLGDVLELGCGGGRMTRPLALMLNSSARALIAADTDMAMLRACRDRLVQHGFTADNSTDTAPVSLVRLSLHRDSIRDAVADTVIGIDALSRVGDVRAFLGLVHRILRPGGRAFFVARNRRFIQAFCQAMAAALVRSKAREGTWSMEHRQVIGLLASLRRQYVHQGDPVFLSSLRDKHLFSSDALTDLAREVGFATAQVAPLDPDPQGGETIRRLCQEAGIGEGFVAEVAPLAVSTGAPYFGLLARQDASALMLLMLTKGVGPSFQTFSGHTHPPPLAFSRPESALGGVPPRWSIELTARDTPEGIVVAVGGWCLVNTDVVWVRLKVDSVGRDAPIWHPRPDVHDVLNGQGLYHPLNALCSGAGGELLFDGVHSHDRQCAVQLEVVLANGVIVQGAAPKVLLMNELTTIVQ